MASPWTALWKYRVRERVRVRVGLQRRSGLLPVRSTPVGQPHCDTMSTGWSPWCMGKQETRNEESVTAAVPSWAASKGSLYATWRAGYAWKYPLSEFGSRGIDLARRGSDGRRSK